ncbi:hypothetical protein A2U01_0027202, partial [Trifolium medium]|nr:hypothetical protein [Trifolium medium]
MGLRHYTRPPDIITGSLKSRPVLQRIDEADAPGSNALGVNRDFIDATMEIVEETPISAQGDAREEPWLLAGDFNDIMSQDEKQGGALVNFRRCRLFQERVNDCKLLDLGAVGSKFTWRGPIYEDGVRIFER